MALSILYKLYVCAHAHALSPRKTERDRKTQRERERAGQMLETRQAGSTNDDPPPVVYMPNKYIQ